MDEQTRMTDEELSALLHADLEDAVSFIETDIGPGRARATNFYHARPFGDEEDGRSQVVMPVVRDNVRATMPSLMRIFYGGRRVVEFIGTNKVSAEQADLMTETVNYVYNRQNPGFEITWSAFKDALVRQVGWIKWWWDDSTAVTARVFENVTAEQLELANATLEDGEELEVVSAKLEQEEQPEQIDPMSGALLAPGQPAVYTYKIRIVSRKKRGQVRVAAVPPEEIVVSRDATSLDSATLVGHRTMKRAGDLVAMGISREFLEDISEGFDELETNEERLARQPTAYVGHQLEDDEPQYLYCELYRRVDYDGDGINELRRIVTVGGDTKIVSNEYADEVQIAGLCPDPEPHVIFGLSMADNLIDIQLIESHITRDMLDSLKSSIFPRTAYVEGQVNADDVLNTEIGAAIRMRQAGMVQPLAVPFVGKEAMPILDWIDAIKERRTGVRGSSPALDAKALQSTNQVAVNAAVTGSQAQVELIARIFAETGMKRLFRGILRLLVQNQQVPLDVVVDGQQVKVDPRKWDVDVEMEVDSGLGTGQSEQKIATLQMVAANQTLALDKLGPDNPLCSLEHLYNTQKRLLELSGMRDTHRFWRDPKTFQAPPPEPPEPTPEEVLAQAQMEIEGGKLELERLKVVLEDDRKRDEAEADVALRAAEISAKYKTSVDVAAINAMMERARMNADERARAQEQAAAGAAE